MSLNKDRIISGAIASTVIVAVVAIWKFDQTATRPGAVLTSTPTSATMPKVIVPARVIPADVNQNMQAALEARERKLQQLAKGNSSSGNGTHTCP